MELTGLFCPLAPFAIQIIDIFVKYNRIYIECCFLGHSLSHPHKGGDYSSALVWMTGAMRPCKRFF